ncbi:MAG: hypothetical protein ABIR96_12880, partial [Bdellovibrionota bacterium]
MARVRLRWNSLLESAAVLGVTAYALGTEIGTYSQLIIQGGGEDGLTYEAYSRDMLLALRSGSWKGFLLGFEQVFYFMPGLRYLISLEKIFFGETHLLGLALLLFLSVLVWRLIGLLVDNKILRIATFCGFLFIDKSARILALDFGNIASYTLWRLTEPWALILLLAALWIVLKSRASREISYIGGLLLGFAVLLRPNIVLIIPAFSILLIFDDERKFSWARLFAFASGLSPILLMLLHNKIFGNEWVLFTTASRIPENQW